MEKPNKFILNPDWIEYQASSEGVKNKIEQHVTMFGNYQEMAEYFPEDFGIDFTKPQWIMITEPPNTPILVPMFSIWLAIPSPRQHMALEGVPWKLWEILTPLGTLGIRFHECRVINLEEYEEYLNTEHCVMKTFAQSSDLGERLSLQMFYLRSRGIGKLDAMKMILKNTDKRDICYFVFNKAYQSYYSKDDRFVLDDVMKHPSVTEEEIKATEAEKAKPKKYIYRKKTISEKAVERIIGKK